MTTRLGDPRPTPCTRHCLYPTLLLAFFLLVLRRSRPAPVHRRVAPLSVSQHATLRAAAFNLSADNARNHPVATRVVAICPLTHHVLPHFLNLRCHARRVMPDLTILPVTLDTATEAAIANLSLPHLRLRDESAHPRSTATPSSSYKPTGRNGVPLHGFNTPAFRSVTKQKLRAVRAVLAAGYDVLLLDADLLLCADLRPALLREMQLGVPDALLPHIFMQSNQRADADRDCELNTGFYFARATDPTNRLFDAAATAATHASFASMDDQDLFQALACGRSIHDDTQAAQSALRRLASRPRSVSVSVPTTRMPTLAHRAQSLQPVSGKKGVCWPQTGFTRMRCVWDRDAIVQALPVREFPSGRKNLWRRHPDDSLREACRAGLFTVYHANFRSGSSKRGFLQNERVWLPVKHSLSCREL